MIDKEQPLIDHASLSPNEISDRVKFIIEVSRQVFDKYVVRPDQNIPEDKLEG